MEVDVYLYGDFLCGVLFGVEGFFILFWGLGLLVLLILIFCIILLFFVAGFLSGMEL